MDTSRRQDLLGVQCLRAMAAILVVIYHALNLWTTRKPGYLPGDFWQNGSAGVDIFFVISGLVMTLSVRRHASRPHPAWAFARDRIVRIIPLYWIMTTLKIAAVLALPALVDRTTLGPMYVAGSYLLLPVRDVTGMIRPVLPVGWTLTYEMLFYVLVTAALAFRVSLGRFCTPALLVFAALALVAPANQFANTIAVEFLFGIAIGSIVGWLQAIPPVYAALIGPVAVAVLLFVPVDDATLRPLTWGLPAAALVACVISAEAAIRRFLPRWLLAAGNASYATYLTHGFVLPAIFFLFTDFIPVAWLGLGMTVVLGVGVSLIAGQVVHVVIERPMLLRLRSRRAASTLPAAG